MNMFLLRAFLVKYSWWRGRKRECHGERKCYEQRSLPYLPWLIKNYWRGIDREKTKYNIRCKHQKTEIGNLNDKKQLNDQSGKWQKESFRDTLNILKMLLAFCAAGKQIFLKNIFKYFSICLFFQKYVPFRNDLEWSFQKHVFQPWILQRFRSTKQANIINIAIKN